VILGTGVDLAEVGRIQASIERYGERFTRRVFTEREVAYAERKANKYERYAARFAAKEAGMKALGTGWSGGITWKDLEVTNLSSGRPTLALHGVARDVADRLGVKTIHLSLTHTSAEAMAWVVLEA
jgi:holo-[acyl-carrier protein] synthase